jgi:hypothetical protein
VVRRVEPTSPSLTLDCKCQEGLHLLGNGLIIHSPNQLLTDCMLWSAMVCRLCMLLLLLPLLLVVM